MGIPGSIGIAAAGGAVLGGTVGMFINPNPPELVGLSTITGIAGGLAGLAGGIAGRFTSPVKAALIGGAIAGLVPTAAFIGARHGNNQDDLALGAVAAITGVGVAGGTAALLAHALLRH